MSAATSWPSVPSCVAATEQEAVGQKGRGGPGREDVETCPGAAEKVLALVPGLRRAAVENRRFLRRVVRFLAAEAGISQFLDIGVGLPTQGAVHEVVREINPTRGWYTWTTTRLSSPTARPCSRSPT